MAKNILPCCQICNSEPPHTKILPDKAPFNLQVLVLALRNIPYRRMLWRGRMLPSGLPYTRKAWCGAGRLQATNMSNGSVLEPCWEQKEPGEEVHCRNIFFVPDSSCLGVWKTEPLPKKSTSNIVSPFGPLLPQVVHLPTKPATFSCATGKCKLFFFPSTQHTEGKSLYKLRVGSYTGQIYRWFTEVCR